MLKKIVGFAFDQIKVIVQGCRWLIQMFKPARFGVPIFEITIQTGKYIAAFLAVGNTKYDRIFSLGV
jgi:hypothetical protein